MQPSVGHIVHYVSHGSAGGDYGSECRAAIITQVAAMPLYGSVPEVGLAVMNPTGLFFHEAVRYDQGGPVGPATNRLCGRIHRDGGTWHWPERV